VAEKIKKIYEVAYSEHTVHHKRFEAASQDEAIAMASKDVEKHFWDVSKPKGGSTVQVKAATLRLSMN
jgi:hypothetical protein